MYIYIYGLHYSYRLAAPRGVHSHKKRVWARCEERVICIPLSTTISFSSSAPCLFRVPLVRASSPCIARKLSLQNFLFIPYLPPFPSENSLRFTSASVPSGAFPQEFDERARETCPRFISRVENICSPEVRLWSVIHGTGIHTYYL